jgi:hypothetical protein
VTDVEQPWVVDDSRGIDIAEADRNLDTEVHESSFPPGTIPGPRDRIRPNLSQGTGSTRKTADNPRIRGLRRSIKLPGTPRIGKIGAAEALEPNRPGSRGGTSRR